MAAPRRARARAGRAGGGSPAEYVDGLHDALLAGAALAAVGAIAAAVLIRGVRAAEAPAVDVPEAALAAA